LTGGYTKELNNKEGQEKSGGWWMVPFRIKSWQTLSGEDNIYQSWYVQKDSHESAYFLEC